MTSSTTLRFTVYSVVLLALVEYSSACFASGICGGGCAPPPPPVCSGGCGGGYACGRYGCYSAKARGSKTLTIKNEKDMTPDEKFMKCCEDRNLPDSCLGKCSFRTYTKAALQAMYFKQDRCPMQAAADIQYCAAQGRDHSDCCVRNGVTTTLAGGKCLTFCDQRPGNVTQLDFTYLACYDRFENMKSCFWQDIVDQSAPSFSFNTDTEVNQEEEQPRFALGSSRTFQAKTFGQ
ncbi:unnamed protein product [Caenorhabditis angaria]|uniref:Domain of unknown function DB domain-containing protein n=1 Tax=Caenorhabditis angaria TaxID=860376 RepID=A0A9P1J1A0_9PELO|nr:unnamed protein product [Caenorhabditis angaria]